MKKSKKNIIIICAVVMLALVFINSFISRTLFSGTQAEEMSYDEFLKE